MTKQKKGDLETIAQLTNSLKRQSGIGFAPPVIAQDSLAGTVKITDSVTMESDSESSAENSPESVDEPQDKAEETPGVDAQQQSGLSSQDVIALIRSAVEPIQVQQAEAQQRAAQAEAQVQQLQAQLSSAKQELNAAKQDNTIFADLQKLLGTSKPPSAPMVNTTTKSNSQPQGLARDFVSLLEDRNLLRTQDNVFGFGASTGNLYATQRDHAPISRFIHDSLNEDRAKGRMDLRESSLVRDLESYFKANGLLAGRSLSAAGPTTGASGVAPNAFLDILSALMRETHNAANIFWQFATTVYDPTSAPGKNVLVPRSPYLAAPTALSDFLLADTTTFNPVGVTIGNSSDSQSLEVTTVPIGIAQYGLGRGTAVGTRPVFIPEFHEALSLVNLMDALNTRLMQNYYRFEELMLRLQYESSTVVVYNDKGAVTSTATNLNAGDDGTLTKGFLNALYSEMYANTNPSYGDGCYAFAINPTQRTQLMNSLGDQYRPVSEQQMQEVSSVFRAATGVEIGRASGYLGNYCNFHLFCSNSFGVGNPGGGNATVTTSSLGVGATVTNDGFAFGPGAVGRGIALPVEIRSQGSPFDLGSAFIWVSREGAGGLDVDAAVSGQQTRVYKVRTTRAAI